MKYYVVLLIAITLSDSIAALINFDLSYSCKNIQKQVWDSVRSGAGEGYYSRWEDVEECNATLTLMNDTKIPWFYSLNNGHFDSLFPIVHDMVSKWTFASGVIPPHSYVNLSLSGEQGFDWYLVCATSNTTLRQAMQKTIGTRTRKRTEGDWKKLKDIIILQGNLKSKETSEKDNIIVITGNAPKTKSFITGATAVKKKQDLMQKLSLVPEKETRSRLDLVG